MTTWANKEVVEFCNICEHEISMNWDVKRLGYKAYCPVCGERLMLCNECYDSLKKGQQCDYSAEKDGCFRWKK